MTIDEAIKILNSIPKYEGFPKLEPTYKAIKLGIEALKRRKYESERTSKWADMPLPGETED